MKSLHHKGTQSGHHDAHHLGTLLLAIVLLIVGAVAITAGTKGALPISDRGSTALAALVNDLRDTDPAVRADAARALGRTSDERAVPSLLTALADEASSVRIYAARSLGQIGDEAAIQPLWDLVASNRPAAERQTAILALGALRATTTADFLFSLAQDPREDSRTRAAALSAIGTIGASTFEPGIRAQLAAGDALLRFNAIRALGRLEQSASVEALAALLGGTESDPIQEAAIEALARIRGPAAADALLALLASGDDYLALRGAEALATMGDARAVPLIRHRLETATDHWIATKLRAALASLEKGP